MVGWGLGRGAGGPGPGPGPAGPRSKVRGGGPCRRHHRHARPDHRVRTRLPPRPYRTELRLRTLPDQAWEDFLDTAAQDPSHIAALLDKDLPHTLADRVDLLPASGDLVPDCSCPDDGYPCKHAAALCYQTARLLDEDPFVLLLMRGRGEQETLAALTRRNTARMAVERETAAPELPTVAAREAVRAASRPELPPRSRPRRARAIRRPSPRSRAPPTRSRSICWPPRRRPGRTPC